MSEEELKAELERLRNENAALKKGASTGIRMKVSEKGAVSIYGMGRFPVTLYKEQWLKLLDMSDDIRAFIFCKRSTIEDEGLIWLAGVVRCRRCVGLTERDSGFQDTYESRNSACSTVRRTVLKSAQVADSLWH